MQGEQKFFSTFLGFPAGTDRRQINHGKAHEFYLRVSGSPHGENEDWKKRQGPSAYQVEETVTIAQK